MFTSNNSIVYKYALLTRNNDCFVKTNKYNIDEEALWKARFILKAPQNEFLDYDY